jgi:hypothetical protein
MRASVTACVLGACGAMTGGWLIGRWALGLVLIALSAAGIAYGVFRDDGAESAAGPLTLSPGRTVAEVLQRAQRAP